MQHPLEILYRPLGGTWYKNRVLAPEISGSAAITQALRALRVRWPEPPGTDDEAPVFVLSAGWGSGSTLLQRLIMSDERTLLWGEPLDHAVPVMRMAQMLAPIQDRWPRDSYFASLDAPGSLKNQWVANLTPPIAELRSAHRAFLQTWLGRIARESGRERWGLKEVRLTADHARYLSWLFPRARFVFLFRDVIKSWASCRHVKWYSVWPEYRVASPGSFAHHWRHLVQGFREAQAELGAQLVRYEDLVSNQVDLEALATYLGTSRLDPAVLDVRLGARSERRAQPTTNELAILHGITDELRDELGYA